MGIFNKEIVPREVILQDTHVKAMKTSERDQIVTVRNPSTRVIFVSGKNEKQPAKPRTQARQQHLKKKATEKTSLSSSFLVCGRPRIFRSSARRVRSRFFKTPCTYLASPVLIFTEPCYHSVREKTLEKRASLMTVTTRMRFELTRENPSGIAGRRLNHSATLPS